MSGQRTYKQQEHMRSKGYLRASEVARILKIHHSAVYRMLDSNQVAELRIGGPRSSRYVSIASLREFLGDAAAQFDDLPEAPPRRRARATASAPADGE